MWHSYCYSGTGHRLNSSHKVKTKIDIYLYDSWDIIYYEQDIAIAGYYPYPTISLLR